MIQFKSILFNSANTFQGQFSGKKMLVSNTYYCKGLTICATNMQHVDLSAQYSSQQGHSDVHAVLCLAEICCSWVCVHLHADFIDSGQRMHHYHLLFGYSHDVRGEDELAKTLRKKISHIRKGSVRKHFC